MTIDVIIEDPRWGKAGLTKLATASARATLAALSLDPDAWDISVLGCDDARIAALNAEFRGRPQPTNVLSWPSEDCAPPHPGAPPPGPNPREPELGDIAIAWETCTREAAAAGLPLTDHVTHLLVHGILHLLGYDHESDKDAAVMEGMEIGILATLGVADPY